MTLSIANTSALTMCDAAVDAVDAGSTDAAGQLVIYDGTPPTLVDDALSGNNILAELDMSTPPSFGNAADAGPGATATANAITDDTAANATGTASFFRIFNRNNVAVLQGAVATSGAELNLNTVSIQSGATVEITSLTITMPEG